MSNIEAFRILTEIPDKSPDFIQAFLRSLDFDPRTRSRICKTIGLNVENNKAAQANAITDIILNSSTELRGKVLSVVLSNLIQRNKWYFHIKYGTVAKRPDLPDPKDL